jgi:hypothetical protein
VRTPVVFNFVAGRVTLDELPAYTGPPKMIFMGDEFRRYHKKVASLLRLPEDALKLTLKPTPHTHHHGHGHGHGHGH